MRARIIGTVINLVVDLSKKGINEKINKKTKKMKEIGLLDNLVERS